MAEKSVITNIEARIRQLIDDHKRLSESCAELTAQRDNLKAENRTLQERIRELDGELSRMQLTEGLAQQAITLKIAGKSYSLNIESEKEEVYRLAEREVNNYLAAIKQNNFKNWTDQDYLSMAALKFAIANVDMRQSRELGDEDLKHLGRLGEEIDAYLNTLQR